MMRSATWSRRTWPRSKRGNIERHPAHRGPLCGPIPLHFMRLLPRITIFRLFLPAALVALPGAVLVAERWWKGKQRREHPEVAFKELTGNNLPEGIAATAYTSEMNNALFR